MDGMSSERTGGGPQSGGTSVRARPHVLSWLRERRPARRGLLRRLAVPFAGLLLTAGLLSRSYGTEVKELTFSPADPQVVRSEPMIIGANVHYGLRRVLGYTSDEVGLDGLAALGVDSFRDIFPWASFSFGTPTSPRLVYSQRLTRFLGHTKLLPLLTLGQSNAEVPGGMPPVSDEALVSFRAYLGEAVQLTRHYRAMYEIWNEWNLSSGIGPVPTRLAGPDDDADPRAASHYVRIANAAVRTIRETAPNARILVGAVGDDPGWGWAKSIVRQGALAGADGLSVHVYNHCMPTRDRTAGEMVRRVQALQDGLKPLVGGTETPIYITEFGWPVFPERCTLDEDRAAANVAQFILLTAPIPWIKGIWVHSMKDVGNNPSDIEDHFGLFRFDNSPKPGVCFFRQATDLVRGAKSIEISEPFDDVFVARLRGADGRQRLVLWTSSRFVEASYRVAQGQGRGRLMCGEGIKADTKTEGPLTPQPLIIDFDAATAVKIEVAI